MDLRWSLDSIADDPHVHSENRSYLVAAVVKKLRRALLEKPDGSIRQMLQRCFTVGSENKNFFNAIYEDLVQVLTATGIRQLQRAIEERGGMQPLKKLLLMLSKTARPAYGDNARASLPGDDADADDRVAAAAKLLLVMQLRARVADVLEAEGVEWADLEPYLQQLSSSELKDLSKLSLDNFWPRVQSVIKDRLREPMMARLEMRYKLGAEAKPKSKPEGQRRLRPWLVAEAKPKSKPEGQRRLQPWMAWRDAWEPTASGAVAAGLYLKRVLQGIDDVILRDVDESVTGTASNVRMARRLDPRRLIRAQRSSIDSTIPESTRDIFFDRLLESGLPPVSHRRLLVALVRPLMQHLFSLLGCFDRHFDEFFNELIDFAPTDHLIVLRWCGRIRRTYLCRAPLPMSRVCSQSVASFHGAFVHVLRTGRSDSMAEKTASVPGTRASLPTIARSSRTFWRTSSISGCNGASRRRWSIAMPCRGESSRRRSTCPNGPTPRRGWYGGL